MIEILVDAISWLLLLAGSFFLVVGAVGLNRMPDLFTRLHATSVSDTLGAGLLIIGMMVQAGLSLVSVKLVFLLLIFLFTSPVAAHAVTRAALSVGVEPKLFDSAGKARRSVLAEVREEGRQARPAPASRSGKSKAPSRGKRGGRSSKR